MSIKYLLGFGKRRRGNLNWNTVTRLSTLFPNSASAAIEADTVFPSPTFRIAGKTTASFVGLSTTYVRGTAPTYLLGASIEGLAPVSFGLLTASYTAPSNYDAAYISVTIYDPTNSDIDLSTALGVDYEVEVGYASGTMQLATGLIMGYIGNFYSAGSQQNVITFGVDDYSATSFIAGAGFARVRCLNDNWNTAGITVGISVALFKDTKHIFAYSNTSVINGNVNQTSGGSPSLGSTAADYSLHVGAFSGDASADPVASSPTIASTSIAGTSFDQMIAYDPTPGSLTVDWTESSGNDYQVHTARVIGLSYNYFDILGSSTTNFIGSSTAGITDYPLVTETANFSLSGIAALIKRNSKLVSNNSVFSLAGQSALLKASFLVRAVNKAYTLAGQVIGIAGAKKLITAIGNFILTRQPALLVKITKLITTSRSYALAGQVVIFVIPNRLLVDSASFILSSAPVLLKSSRISRAISAGYSLLGQAVPLVKSIKIFTVSRSYALTRTPALIKYSRISKALNVAFTLTGQALSNLISRVFISDSSTYTLVGQPAIFTPSGSATEFTLLTESQSFLVAFQSNIVVKGIPIVADSASFYLGRTPALVKYNKKVIAPNKAYTLTGQVVPIVKNYSRYIIAVPRDYNVTTQSANLINTGAKEIKVESANFVLTRTPANLKIPAKLVATSRTYTSSLQDANLIYSGTVHRVLIGISNSYILTRTPSSVVRSRVIYDPFIPRYRLNKPLYIISTEPVTGASNSNRRGNIIAGGLH